MLFEIDDSVSDFLYSSAATTQDFGALNYLALGAAEGSHRIVGRRSSLAKLARLQALGLRESKALERAAGRVAQEGQLAHRLRVVGRVVVGVQSAPSTEVIGERRITTFPLRWFDGSAKIQPISLIGENLSDVAALLKIAEAGTILASFGYLPVKAYRISGGGSTTANVLRQIAMSGQACVCVVDSDRTYPAGDIGATAQGIATFKDNNTYPLVEVLETTGRDLENALPDSFYLKVYGSHQNHGPLAKLLVQLTTCGEREVRDHLDIQNGITLRDVFGRSSQSPGLAFWRSKLDLLLASTEIPQTALPCLSAESCQQPTEHECICLIVPGNRANVLDDFVRNHEETDRYKLVQYLDDSVRAEWLRLGSRIASWCCGDAPLRL